MSEAVQTTETTAPAPAPTGDEQGQIEALAAKLFKADDAAPSGADADPAAAASAGESTAESAETQPAPPPENPRVAARIAAATRAELRAAQSRAELKAQQTEIERREAELKAKESRFRLLEEDPVKAFEELKLDPKTFLEKLSGEYKPEAVADRELKAIKAELEALKAKSAKDEETAKQRAEREQQEAMWRQASQGFVQFIEASADKFPHLVAEYSEEEALDAAYKALHEVVGHDEHGRPVTRNEAYFAQFGAYPDDDVVAEHLDAQAKARAEARQNSAWRKRGESAVSGSQPLSNGDPIPKAPPVNKGSSPRTLTSRTASEKATAPRQMTQEEIDAESMRILASGFKS